jgi:hypothetical protein
LGVYRLRREGISVVDGRYVDIDGRERSQEELTPTADEALN